MNVFHYRVAGYLLRIEAPQGRDLPARLKNLAPFFQEGDFTEEAPLFTLRLASEPLPGTFESFFKTEDGPGFPEIAISRRPDAFRFRFSALPGRPVAGTLDTSTDFRQATLALEGVDDVFALNNAMMLQFAFASALEGALEMHASVVVNGGRGYLFLGRSGTGKSTHSSLWLKHIPGTELLNDDNPVLRLEKDGTVRVYGSPWSGKTPCYKAMDCPVGAVVRISQAPYNRIERLSLVQAYASLMASASSFRPFRELSDGWHRTLESLAGKVPCYVLDCLPDREAAELCYRTVHG